MRIYRMIIKWRPILSPLRLNQYDRMIIFIPFRNPSLPLLDYTPPLGENIFMNIPLVFFIILLNYIVWMDMTLSSLWLELYFFVFFYNLIFLFGCTYGMQKFPGQVLNPCLSGNQSHNGDNTRSLTHWATRELLYKLIMFVNITPFRFIHVIHATVGCSCVLLFHTSQQPT